MCLRFPTAYILGTALAVSSLAHAKTPSKPTPEPIKVPAPSSSSASGLAQVQAIFSYCESVDPHSRVKYVMLQTLLLSGDSPAGILADEKSAAYRSEFSSVTAELAGIPATTGVVICRSAITGL